MDLRDGVLLIRQRQAIYLLGTSYWKGASRIDFKMAEDLLTKASQLGHADAHYQLGHLLMELFEWILHAMASSRENPTIPDPREWIPLMKARAEAGSQSANSFFTAQDVIVEAEKVLDNEPQTAFRMLRIARRIWPVPLVYVTQPFHS